MESCCQDDVEDIYPDLKLVYTFVPILVVVMDIHLSEAPVTDPAPGRRMSAELAGSKSP